MPTIFYPLRDPITEVSVKMVTLQFVDLVIKINHRPQDALRMTPLEAREFLLNCIADDTPAVRYTPAGREWLMGYNKQQLIDGQGNIVNRKDIP